LTATRPDVHAVLFVHHHAEFAREAEAAGLDGFVVDWERRGKTARQRDYDFEINGQGAREVRRLAAVVSRPILVRINPPGPRTGVELQKAIDAGAREIMLPMARKASEVERFLELASGRVRTVVQIETQDLVDDLPALARLPWDSAYIGLNDLQISRGGRGSIWSGVADGTVEHIYRSLPGREIGFAGITVADGGHPLPFAFLFAEMVRLGCALSFLRRTFHQEIAGRDMAGEVAAIRRLEIALRARDATRISEDRAAFTRLLAPFAA
jgi:2-keto-3-deoxy-L-rhamnonate aldolase RhmA